MGADEVVLNSDVEFPEDINIGDKEGDSDYYIDTNGNACIRLSGLNTSNIYVSHDSLSYYVMDGTYTNVQTPNYSFKDVEEAMNHIQEAIEQSVLNFVGEENKKETWNKIANQTLEQLNKAYDDCFISRCDRIESVEQLIQLFGDPFELKGEVKSNRIMVDIEPMRYADSMAPAIRKELGIDAIQYGKEYKLQKENHLED